VASGVFRRRMAPVIIICNIVIARSSTATYLFSTLNLFSRQYRRASTYRNNIGMLDAGMPASRAFLLWMRATRMAAALGMSLSRHIARRRGAQNNAYKSDIVTRGAALRGISISLRYQQNSASRRGSDIIKHHRKQSASSARGRARKSNERAQRVR